MVDDVLHRHVDVVNAAAGAGVRQLADRRDDGLLVTVVHTDRALVRSANLSKQVKNVFYFFFYFYLPNRELISVFGSTDGTARNFLKDEFFHTVSMTYLKMARHLLRESTPDLAHNVFLSVNNSSGFVFLAFQYPSAVAVWRNVCKGI